MPRKTPESVPPDTAGTETTSTPTTASPASAVTAPSANAETSAVRRRWRSSAPSAGVDAGGRRLRRTVGDQLRGAGERLDELGRKARPGGCLAP